MASRESLFLKERSKNGYGWFTNISISTTIRKGKNGNSIRVENRRTLSVMSVTSDAINRAFEKSRACTSISASVGM